MFLTYFFPYAIQFHKIFVMHKNEISFCVTTKNFVKSEYKKTSQYTRSNFTPILITPPFLFSPSAPEALRSSSVLEARYLVIFYFFVKNIIRFSVFRFFRENKFVYYFVLIFQSVQEESICGLRILR